MKQGNGGVVLDMILTRYKGKAVQPSPRQRASSDWTAGVDKM